MQSGMKFYAVNQVCNEYSVRYDFAVVINHFPPPREMVHLVIYV